MRRAVEYLPYYAEQYETAEIDSWFYRIPESADVREYKEAVPETFRFTCKVPQQITLTHHRKKNKDGSLNPNSDFLSAELFKEFLEKTEALHPQLDAVMFEFEYLNKQKMSGISEFIDRFGEFLHNLPAGLPYALEIRNGNYLKDEYFDFIKESKLIYVFSEKIYMPHIYDVYEQNDSAVFTEAGRTVIRLMGGDRKEIEKKADGAWNKLVDAKDDLDRIAGLISSLSKTAAVTVNVNNHYEGSAPKSIDRLKTQLS
jgi:uncharacterized protein YecE (DUF72 family)